jgi:arylsulfatase A-like enzyme
VHPLSGDLVLEVAEGCLVSDFDSGTTHGSPYLYDRRVPVLFRGPGVEPGRVPGRAATIDIAPTLAKRIGVRAPDDLDGRPLPLAGSHGSPLPFAGSHGSPLPFAGSR